MAQKIVISEQSNADSFIVNTVLEYMRIHCTERISLATVADHVYVSQWHLYKLINRHTNQSLLKLLNSMRSEQAKNLLSDPALRIHAIAQQVGYSDVAHFSKSFKKITGRIQQNTEPPLKTEMNICFTDTADIALLSLIAELSQYA